MFFIGRKWQNKKQTKGVSSSKHRLNFSDQKGDAFREDLLFPSSRWIVLTFVRGIQELQCLKDITEAWWAQNKKDFFSLFLVYWVVDEFHLIIFTQNSGWQSHPLRWCWCPKTFYLKVTVNNSDSIYWSKQACPQFGRCGKMYNYKDHLLIIYHKDPG